MCRFSHIKFYWSKLSWEMLKCLCISAARSQMMKAHETQTIMNTIRWYERTRKYKLKKNNWIITILISCCNRFFLIKYLLWLAGFARRYVKLSLQWKWPADFIININTLDINGFWKEITFYFTYNTAERKHKFTHNKTNCFVLATLNKTRKVSFHKRKIHW